MKTNKLKIFLYLITLLLISNYSFTQIVKRAQSGFRFLENPISAEAIGKGGVGVATITNSNAVFWNPAGVGWISNTIDLNVNYTKGIADINYFSTSLGIRIGDIGVIALNGIMMDYGDFYGTRRADNEFGYVETETFSPKAMAFGLTVSQKISSNFSYGVNLKYVYQDLGGAWVGSGGTSLSDPKLQISSLKYSHGEFAVDIGAYYDFLFHGIRFGASLQNVSREIQYEVEKFPMPFAVSFGITIDPLSFLLSEDNKDHALLFSIESRHPRDFKEKVKFGLEYKFAGIITLRTGYMDNLDERGFTAGIGLSHNLEDINLKVDYGYEAFGIFGAVHFISLGISY